MTEFKELIGQIVEKLYLIVWPPWGEENEAEVDISFGFVFKSNPNKLCIVSVDKDELWSPHISLELLPESKYLWEDFYHRVGMWMSAVDENSMLGKEYYDVTESELLNNIVRKEIEGIEFLYIKGNPQPFGIKILFKDDYIISMPNSDGNTVQTKFFNKTDSIDNFKLLGDVIFE